MAHIGTWCCQMRKNQYVVGPVRVQHWYVVTLHGVQIGTWWVQIGPKSVRGGSKSVRGGSKSVRGGSKSVRGAPGSDRYVVERGGHNSVRGGAGGGGRKSVRGGAWLDRIGTWWQREVLTKVVRGRAGVAKMRAQPGGPWPCWSGKVPLRRAQSPRGFPWGAH